MKDAISSYRIYKKSHFSMPLNDFDISRNSKLMTKRILSLHCQISEI